MKIKHDEEWLKRFTTDSRADAARDYYEHMKIKEQSRGRTWINSWLPDQDVEVEILTKENEIKISEIEWVYDSNRDTNSNTPKWWDEDKKQNIELRDVIAWRYK